MPVINANTDRATSKPRETSIDIHVPELAKVLAPWRDASVPVAAKGIPPHSTLLYPWRRAPLADHDLAALRAAIAGFTPFGITIGSFGRFPTGILFLQLADDSAVRALMRAIHAAFPDTPPYGGTFRDPAPHLTVAKVSGAAELDRVAAEARSRSALVCRSRCRSHRSR